MKKILLALAVAMMMTACEREHDELADADIEINIPTDSMKNHATINFVCSPYTMRAMTRATLSELSLTDLWVFDYVGGVLQSTNHQSSSDAAFGSPSLDLEYGSHTLYFVASRGADPSVSGQVITWSSVRDTFWSSLSLDVEPMTATSQSVALSRVVARLRIVMTDAVPTGAAKLNVTPSQWYLGLDYTTGEPSSPSSPSLGVSIPSSYIGTTSLNASFYTVSTAAMWQTDVEVAITSANDAVLGSVLLPDVPLQRNHVTNYQGSVMSSGRSVTVTSDDEWVEDDTVTW